MISQILKAKKISGILINKPENVHYLSGFKGSFGELVFTKNKKFLLTDSRYELEAQKNCNKSFEIIIIEDYQEDLKKLAKKLRLKSLGFESNHLTYSRFLSYKKILKGIKLEPLKNDIDLLRIIKTEEEIHKLQLSQNLNEKVLTSILPLLKIGTSEIEIAKKIVIAGLDLGADCLSFEPIVAFGKNAASPHYTPSNYKLRSNEPVLIDMGFKLNGYCSDMSRTFLPKNSPSALLAAYSAVLEAQENCINTLRAGDQATTGDTLSRSLLEKYNLSEYFTHANGHGIGLEIHEAPSLSHKLKHKDRNIILQKNMVVTVEPGVYIQNQFGIRIEDMIVIKGKTIPNKNLTSFTKSAKGISILD